MLVESWTRGRVRCVNLVDSDSEHNSYIALNRFTRGICSEIHVRKNWSFEK